MARAGRTSSGHRSHAVGPAHGLGGRGSTQKEDERKDEWSEHRNALPTLEAKVLPSAARSESARTATTMRERPVDSAGFPASCGDSSAAASGSPGEQGRASQHRAERGEVCDREAEQDALVDAQELDGEAEQAGEQEIHAEHALVGRAGGAEACEQ